MKYQRYPTYKDSGVKWIGEIPEDWVVTKLKFISFISADYGVNIRADNYIDKGVRFIRITDINEDGSLIPEGVFIREDLSKGKILERGDLLFARSGSVGTSLLFAFADSQKYSFAGYLVRFRLKNRYSPSFVYLFSQSKLFKDQIKMNSIETTIENFNGDKYSNLKISLPDTKIQENIVSSLNMIFSHINSLILKFSKMIELLNEKRQAIITNAVTKGLDPNVQIKDSGIEWIGEIPEDWKLKRLKYVVKLVNEKCEQGATQIALENIESWSGKYIFTIGEFKGEGIRFQSGDILFGKLRPYLAKVYLAGFSGAAVGDFFVLRSYSDVEPIFLFNWLIHKEFINIVNSATYGAKMPRVDWRFMGELLVTIPPKRDQIKISDNINAKTSQIDSLITKQRKMIELLKEYKTSLITQAVTGKIDVRGIAISTDSNSV